LSFTKIRPVWLFDRDAGDAQFVRDLGVGEAFSDQSEYVEFAAGQLGDVIPRG
jgi:hypothetical protein